MSFIQLYRRSGHVLLFSLLIGVLLPACSPIKYEVELKCPPGGGGGGPSDPGLCRERAAVSVDVATDTGAPCAVGLPSVVCKYPGMTGCDTTNPSNVCKTTNSGANTQCFCQCKPK